MKAQYITTAIDYPNAAPHMGHVLEKVLADVCARWMRLRGDAVRFQIGTDEHGIKIQRKAEKEGLSPQELVDRNVPLFEDLYSRLHISHDFFIRTSDQQVHWPTVVELWKRIQEAGELELHSYTGFYCPGCERFMTERDLEDGLCPNHQKAPEEVTEENWFLRMSAYGEQLRKLLTDEWDGESYRIVPQFRENETLSLIEQGLEDVSFSRPRESLAWGVPVPDDDSQTMYVWCDALTNYISGLGYFGGGFPEVACHERATEPRVQWWKDAEVTHVIGKDIARFHALIWPLMLKLSGVRTPDTLLIHGFLTSEGQKMSKSLGNIVVPDDVLALHDGNPDPLRFYLSHEVPVGRDGDFSWDRYRDLYDSLLRNKLGNLLNRVTTLLKKEDADLSIPLRMNGFDSDWEQYYAHMNAFDLSVALKVPLRIADICNEEIDARKPWSMETESKIVMLSDITEQLRHLALMLLPFVPSTAQRISRQLGVPYADHMLEKEFTISNDMKKWAAIDDWKRIGEPEILFKPLED